MLVPFTGISQHFQYNFNNITVSEALLEVAKQSEIRISFDDTSLKEFVVDKTIETDSIALVLEAILDETGYISTFKHNTWLIIKSSPKQHISYKRLVGIIYDKATGERLPYANIFLGEKNSVIPATVDGTFSAKVKESKNCFLQISYIGYNSLDTIIDVRNIEKVVHFGLKQKLQNIATISVKGEALEMIEIGKDAGEFKFNPNRFSDLPNYGETDIFRALQFLPGISASENSSELNIRGSSADQNLVRFDGFTLYNLDHFFGVFSALNPNVIKDIQVYRGGFDSRFGERVSGIVDITGKSGNKNNPVFYGGVNMISANLTTEIPISEKLTVVAAGRRAYSDVYSSWLADAILADKTGQTSRFPGPDNVIEPEFYFSDYNVKLNWALSESDNISFSAYGSKDNLNSSNVSENDLYDIDTEDTNEWGNSGFGFSWKKQHRKKFFTNLQVGHSGYYNDYKNNTVFSGSLTDDGLLSNLPENMSTNEENDLIDYFFSFQNTWITSNHNQLQFGVSAKYNEFTFYKDADAELVYNKLKRSAMLYTGFLQDQFALGKKLKVKPGFRVNFYDDTKKFYIEPRLAANYHVNKQLLLKVATGRYYQFLNKASTEQDYGYNRDFWVLADGGVHPVVSSNHYIVGASFETQKFFFDLEAYYKSVDGLQEYLFVLNPRDRNSEEQVPEQKDEIDLSRFISGSGDAYGIDFLVRYENRNFTSWLAYSLSKSTRNFSEINNGSDIPASFDQTHEVKWTNIYSYNKWNFSTLTLYTTGQPYIASSSKDDSFNVTREYERLPDYFRFDISVNYNFNFKKVNIKPGFSILNAFNTENYLDVYLRDFNFQNREFRETTLVKAQDITLNFFVNFRF